MKRYFEIMQTILFIKILSARVDVCSRFSTFIIHSFLSYWSIFYIKNTFSFLLIYLFIYLLIYVSMESLIVILFTSLKSLLSICILVVNFSRLSQWTLFELIHVCVFLTCQLILYFFTFCNNKRF